MFERIITGDEKWMFKTIWSEKAPNDNEMSHSKRWSASKESVSLYMLGLKSSINYKVLPQNQIQAGTFFQQELIKPAVYEKHL